VNGTETGISSALKQRDRNDVFIFFGAHLFNLFFYIPHLIGLPVKGGRADRLA
jgi:hypothetical protein